MRTLAIHAGQNPDPSTGAIWIPVYQTSTYVQSTPGEHAGYDYARTANPTRTALENNLAALEGAKHGLAFASGCAAADALMHLFKSGDHIICADDVYGGTYRLFDKVFTHAGLSYSFIDLTDLNSFEQALKTNTRAVWIESPSNPLLKIIDLKALCTKAHQHNIIVICDNTFMSPVFQRPLDFNCDLVMHSTTKYIGGHSDVVGGFICTNDHALAEQLRFLQNSIGGVPGPWDVFLVLRGTKTLPLRMEAHNQNASQVAAFLKEHPGIERVIYPGLESHPQHALAKRQMSGFGGIISFIIKGGLDHARKFLTSLKVFTVAESLGGIESLAEHPAIMTHASIEPEIRQRIGIVDGLIRLSVGIEDIQDLLDDLEQALKKSS